MNEQATVVGKHGKRDTGVVDLEKTIADNHKRGWDDAISEAMRIITNHKNAHLMPKSATERTKYDTSYKIFMDVGSLGDYQYAQAKRADRVKYSRPKDCGAKA